MRAVGEPVHELAREVKAVKWLSLKQAIDTLTRAHEKIFLANVGPAILKAAKQAMRDKITKRSVRNGRKRHARSAPAVPAVHLIAGDDADGLALGALQNVSRLEGAAARHVLGGGNHAHDVEGQAHEGDRLHGAEHARRAAAFRVHPYHHEVIGDMADLLSRLASITDPETSETMTNPITRDLRIMPPEC